ncbi:hypothetical protein IMG5_191970 [Ichthyophthirius multifiliis]|uniref:Uncharacterized protein n=1 Tax=Ichthyophthirius multifiliis TaxID=5932 RepID=G0R4F5_ICHMU|nr:hypothetical protein IMG5_191970 [Ichthyophthirius multifiliis]EGR27656.1 hypothetical protein IMG5_191970 [Ichthyophthirius multifiliis]|eukprot:XP_004025108.1 hypothetical protein IMG5_191970 [Ichthyophthirius multifiliis]
MGASVAKYSLIKNKEIHAKFLYDNDFTKSKLFYIANSFEKDVKQRLYIEKGWPENIYYMSKILLNSYTGLLVNYKNIHDNQIRVYGCCPGWVKTDLGGPKAPMPVERSLITPLYLLGLQEFQQEIQGKLFLNKKVVSLE